MMVIKLFIFLIVSFKVLSTTDKNYEFQNQVEKIIATLHLKNNDQKYEIYLNLGRLFQNEHSYPESEKYFKLATQIKTSNNKSEAHVYLISNAVLQNELSKIKLYFENAQNYFSLNPQFKSNEIKYFLKSIEDIMTSKNQDIRETNGLYETFTFESKIKFMIQEHNYNDAFKLFDTKKLQNTNNHNFIILYDLLNVATNKNKVSKLYCEKEFIKNSEAYTYNILTCGFLISYLKNGKMPESKLKRTKDFFEIDDPKNKYILNMILEINQ